MQVLQEATALKQGLALHGHPGVSTSALPVVTPLARAGGYSFVGAGGRALRILSDGAVDLEGGPSGPLTLFRASCGGDAETLFLQSERTGLWLSVVSGQFVGAAEAAPVVPSRVVGPAVAEEAKPAVTRLRATESGALLPWAVSTVPLKPGTVLLCTENGNVVCNQKGRFSDRGGRALWAQWEVESSADGSFSLRNVGHSRFLALDAAGSASLSDEPCAFALDDAVSLGLPPVEDLAALSAVELSDDDRLHFREHGFVVLRGAVPPDRVRAALKLINFTLGQPDCWQTDGEDKQPKLNCGGSGGFGEVLRSPVLWAALNALLGIGHKGGDAQVALRFPQSPLRGDGVDDRNGYHIDGMNNKKTLFPFSLLCGVALSDQSRPHSGNLHIFPGSHLNPDVHEWYKTKHCQEDAGEAGAKKPNLGESVQVLLAPGDVVLAHQLLAHSAGVNFSENIRYQLFFRVRHARHEELRDQVITNPWVEFDS